MEKTVEELKQEREVYATKLRHYTNVSRTLLHYIPTVPKSNVDWLEYLEVCYRTVGAIISFYTSKISLLDRILNPTEDEE